ncbi:MAG TPA: ABC transporter permease [Planctomycetaceae bacterium]|jgi:molybdate transport system permease protein|nr:ABC transporter permease [Planctomycetaceae bacterium]
MALSVATPRSKSDVPFYAALAVLGGSYVLLILAMVAAELIYARPGDFARIFADQNIRYAIRLSVISSTVTTILSLWVSVPIAYLMSRSDFRGKQLIDAIIDIPIVLPPLVVGLCLLILFRQTPLRHIDDRWPIAFHVPAVILAQFAVVSAFAVRTLRATFDEISPRQEQVALTLGCSRAQAFWLVVLPEARYGLLSAGTLAWARALGEFGPVLVFAGATRQRTEVLPVSVYLELSIGNVEGAVAVSLVMIAVSVVVLVTVRVLTRGHVRGGMFGGRM